MVDLNCLQNSFFSLISNLCTLNSFYFLRQKQWILLKKNPRHLWNSHKRRVVKKRTGGQRSSNLISTSRNSCNLVYCTWKYGGHRHRRCGSARRWRSSPTSNKKGNACSASDFYILIGVEDRYEVTPSWRCHGWGRHRHQLISRAQLCIAPNPGPRQCQRDSFCRTSSSVRPSVRSLARSLSRHGLFPKSSAAVPLQVPLSCCVTHSLRPPPREKKIRRSLTYDSRENWGRGPIVPPGPMEFQSSTYTLPVPQEWYARDRSLGAVNSFFIQFLV